MRKMIKVQFYLFFNNKLMLFLYILMCIVPVFAIFGFAFMGAEATFIFNVLTRFIVFFNIIFIICSYLFLVMDRKNKVDEVLECLKKPKLYRNLSILVLLLLLIIFNCIILITLILSGIYINNISFICELIYRYYFMNLLLPQLCTFSMMILISHIKKSGLALSLFVLIIFLISPYLDSFSWAQKPVFPIDKIVEIIKQPFSVFLQNSEVSIDTLYGYQNEIYKLYICLFWISSALISLFSHRLNRKKILVFLVAPCLFLVGVYMPQSKYRMDDSWDRGKSDINYYHVIDMENIYQKSKEPEYLITKYQLNIDINRKLNVSGKLKISSDKENKDFVFTLYHGYKVRSLSCENEMIYEQVGDYIRISFKSPIQEFELKIEYDGYHPLLYSNNQAVQLPGYFAWYPMAGERQLYVSLDSEVYWDYGYNPYNRVKNAEFEVSIDAPYTVVTNLKEYADGKYHDISDSFTLVGGYLEQVEDSQIINFFPLYSSHHYPNEQYIESYQENKKQLNEGFKLIFKEDTSFKKNKKVIVCSNGLNQNSSLGIYSEFDDYILIGKNGFLGIQNYLAYYLYNKDSESNFLKDTLLLSLNENMTKEQLVQNMQQQVEMNLEVLKSSEDNKFKERYNACIEFKNQMNKDIEKLGVEGYVDKISKELMG